MSDKIKRVKLGKLVKIQSGYSPSSFILKDNGPVPYIKVEDMNNCDKYQEFSRFYTEDAKRSVPQGAVIFPKRGAAIMNNKVRIALRPICMDTNMMALIPDANKLDSEYLFNIITYEKLFKIADTSTIPQINNKHIDPYIIPLPEVSEQKEIVAIITKWDRVIEVTENLTTAKKQQFEWLTTRLINQSGGKKKLLADFITEVSTRNRGSQIERVLSVTNRNGFVLPEDQFERRVASADVSNYKVVERGQYAYNPSRINVGSIARLDIWDNGILSPMYTVFKLDSKKINSDYFLHWLSSTEAKQRIRNSAQGSVRETVSFDNLGSIPLALPNLAEQNSITHTLNNAQAEIKLLQALAEKYRTQKRGLMQKLLSGQWRLGGDKEAA